MVYVQGFLAVHLSLFRLEEGGVVGLNNKHEQKTQ